ncbi:solute carrier family 49 member 4-like [Dreissena polymorpha]|nr:solute carrier family 49 member 4-like [Dreissena polymorpha]
MQESEKVINETRKDAYDGYESEPLLPAFREATTGPTSKTRWYVLSMVSMATIVNNFLWSSWGSISQSTQLAYGWSEETLFWVTNVGNITGFIFALLGVYLVDIKGVRTSMLVCNGAMFLTAATRVITMQHAWATVLLAIGQGINGLATTVTMSMPAAVSNTWFGLSERTTATAVSVLSAAMGGAAALLGPLTVDMPQMNNSIIMANQTDLAGIQQQMRHFNYETCGVTVLLLFCSVVYLPSKPEKAPSRTAHSERFGFTAGIRHIFKNPSMWLIAAMFALPIGFFGNWLSFLDVILNPFEIAQAEVGWISFYGSVCGVAGGILLGRFADMYKKKMKWILVALNIIVIADFGWFSCMCVNLLPYSKAAIYVSVIAGAAIVGAAGPLYLELGCETAYPVGEGMVAGFLGMVINFGSAVFLLVDQAYAQDTGWTNWALVGVYTAAVPILILFREKYTRVDIDIEAIDGDG